MQNTAIRDHKYFVAVTPSDESGQSNFVTLDKTIQLTALYNCEYNVTVVANNCAGNSSEVSTTFNISKSTSSPTQGHNSLTDMQVRLEILTFMQFFVVVQYIIQM